MNQIWNEAQELFGQMVEDRRALHQNPEVGMELPRTKSYVIKQLQDMGYETVEVGACGVSALAGGKKGTKTFLLRADMDALPMKEESGLEFSSVNEYAHTCGHDMHTAMLLGAARLLKKHEEELEGTVKLMFQPDEERLTGARSMIEAGILENPKVEAAMALHVMAQVKPAGMMAYSMGACAASSDSFRIELKGHGGHGAMPHMTIDPLSVAAHIVIGLQEINARETDPAKPLVITVCSLHSGDAHNIIPESAVMEGSIRAYSADNREMAKRRLKEIAEGMASLYRCECKVTYPGGTPALVNDCDLTAELKGYAADIVPAMVEMPVNMASEDFACVAELVPSSYFVLAAGGEDDKYLAGGQHHPKVVFNEDILPYGAAGMAHCAMSWLKAHK